MPPTGDTVSSTAIFALANFVRSDTLFSLGCHSLEQATILGVESFIALEGYSALAGGKQSSTERNGYA
jgi:hypothetical protein